jgi:hypothetical protein
MAASFTCFGRVGLLQGETPHYMASQGAYPPFVSDARGSYVVECYWTDVNEADIARLDREAADTARAMSHQGGPVSYTGSILMAVDEVVLFLFDGVEEAVRATAEAVGLPFERIVGCTLSPRLSGRS